MRLFCIEFPSFRRLLSSSNHADAGAAVSVADNKLNAPRTSDRLTGRGLSGSLAALRARHPRLAATVIHGAEVGVWVAFYVVVRALVG